MQRVVVIGGSTGALHAMQSLAASLPEDFPAPICLVIHTAPDSPGLIAPLLDKTGPLTATTAADKEPLLPGRIYVAPPDHHLLLESGRVRLTKGPREHRFRPAVDPLFRSAAETYGTAAIGVVLSGNLDDGTAGLWAIKRMGGIAVAQDPRDAAAPSMPTSAIRYAGVDHRAPIAQLGSLLTQLVKKPVEEVTSARVPLVIEVQTRIAKEDRSMDIASIGEPSIFACPECHGVLLRLKEDHPQSFRCHTGHAFSTESLLSAVNDAIEDSLWGAIRTLQEGAMLMRYFADGSSGTSEDAGSRSDLERQARETEEDAAAMRHLVTARERLNA